jgi:transaldolase
MVRPHYDDAHDVLTRLARIGVDDDEVVAVLEREGIEKFTDSWTALAATVRASLIT